jgi:hypothetical protein
MDETALREYQKDIERLKKIIADEQQRGNSDSVQRYQREVAEIESYIKKNRNIQGKSRNVPGRREKARTRVKGALDRAIASIRREDQLNALADHLDKNIDTGTSIICRDTHTQWNV